MKRSFYFAALILSLLSRNVTGRKFHAHYNSEKTLQPIRHPHTSYHKDARDRIFTRLVRTLGKSVPCVPGEEWNDACNDCFCTEEGIVMCTQRSCLGRPVRNPSSCREGSIPCENGLCVPSSWKCDGVMDCLTGKDEADCDKDAQKQQVPVIQTTGKVENTDFQLNRIKDEINILSQVVQDMDKNAEELNKNLNESLVDTHSHFQVIRSKLQQLSLDVPNIKILVRELGDGLDKKLASLNSSLWTIQETQNEQLTVINKDITALQRMTEDLNVQMANAFSNLSRQISNVTGKITKGFGDTRRNKESSDKNETEIQEMSYDHIRVKLYPENVREILRDSTSRLKKIKEIQQKWIQAPNIPVSESNFPCPLGFVKWKDSCYYISQQTAHFPSASFQCRDWGSYLLTIDSEEEDKTLRNILVGKGGGESFITGASDILVQREYVWDMTQRNLVYSNTDAKRNRIPERVSMSNCLALYMDHPTYYWSEFLNCFYRLGNSGSRFICEKNLTREAQGATQGAEQENSTLYDFYRRLKNFEARFHFLVPDIAINKSSSCPNGFQRINNHCYIASKEKMSWYTANYMCKDYGSWLMTVDTSQKAETIQKALNDSTPGREGGVWIGGHGLYQQDQYMWSENGLPILESQGNLPNQIINLSEQNCLAFYKGVISNLPCHEFRGGFVCERNLVV